MGDADYENEYLDRKKRLRELHKKLKDTKDVQEIYHKIMGSAETGDASEETENSSK